MSIEVLKKCLLILYICRVHTQVEFRMGQVRSGKLINLTWNFFSGQVRSGHIRLFIWPDLNWNLKIFRIYIKNIKKNGAKHFFWNIAIQFFILKSYKKVNRNTATNFLNINQYKKVNSETAIHFLYIKLI